MFWSRGASSSKQSQQQAPHPSLEDASTCRILVVGNPGVGKSSFVHLLGNGTVMANPRWTCGAQLEVVAHAFENEVFVMELWDVGASPKFKKSRRVFYKLGQSSSTMPSQESNSSGIDGLILVHDLANKKSFANLTGWMREVMREISTTNEVVWDHDLFFNGGDNSLPVLLVGTKADLVPIHLRQTAELAELGVDSVDISTQDVDTFAPDSPAFAKISSFFDKVIINRENVRRHVPLPNSSYAAAPIDPGSPRAVGHGTAISTTSFEAHPSAPFPIHNAQDYPPTTRNQRPSAVPSYNYDNSDAAYHYTIPHSRQSTTTYTNILDDD